MGGGRWRTIRLPLPALHTSMTARVWSPAGDGDRLLIAHDGPEYESQTGLTARLPGCHVALLPPGELREDWYAASPAYARALALEIVPRLRARLGARPVVGAGASLGALAMLHAQRSFPAGFAGLFLQSGSFFQPRHDRQESGFAHWSRIVRYVRRVLTATRGPAVPVTLTCGSAEENLANNRDMADALDKQGYATTLAVVPGGHDWATWRTALDPHLTALLNQAWPE
ncbi:Enterochelin esterase [Actinoplanes sp. SE50]|uniref:alpha/beta hydrolase n=1 Tax=unclassified Actinoplanes TaxID=2626549 RepID=UPI00023ECC93|nr:MULTISPECIES: alpha/beta hydrolase-fold protein [unclassified Actinoplanes]AEV83783.1 Enterochelin esterase [Actinoplanes sp. SE50/110]ATO82073.1 Enterochelin esterase [Actinoplanes sp. SE50]SLL99481.1 enterochelin esterase [Actinoplanes sp. SE50/110]